MVGNIVVTGTVRCGGIGQVWQAHWTISERGDLIGDRCLEYQEFDHVRGYDDTVTKAFEAGWRLTSDFGWLCRHCEKERDGRR